MVLLFQLYNKTSQTQATSYLEIDPKTGKTTKSVPVSSTVVTAGWEMVLGADAYDADARVAYQLWEGGHPATGQTITAVSMDSGKLDVVETQLGFEDFLGDPIFYGGRLFGWDVNGFLVSVDVKSGSVAKVSRVALGHSPSPWYPTLYRASATGPQLLYVSNTTNGGGSTRRALREMRLRTSTRRRATGSSTGSTAGGGDAGAAMADDDDGIVNTHSSLVGFDLTTGDIVDGPVALSAPVTWMNALDSA